MKEKYIFTPKDNKTKSLFFCTLTENKIYDAKVLDFSTFRNSKAIIIKNDIGIETAYEENLFTKISDIRNKKIEQLLNQK